MVNQQVLVGKWNEVSGKLKEKWGNLADDDLRAFSGNVDQLVGQIQRKTGESRAAIEHFLGEVAEEASGAASNLREKAQQGMESAAGTVRQGYEALRHGLSDAERTVQGTVQERPAQSLAVAFGLGVATGIGLALLFRDRPSESTLARGRAATEQFGRQMMDALSNVMPQR
ncbi:MAG: CsbD family protein [Pirellulales bacterium]